MTFLIDIKCCKYFMICGYFLNSSNDGHWITPTNSQITIMLSCVIHSHIPTVVSFLKSDKNLLNLKELLEVQLIFLVWITFDCQWLSFKEEFFKNFQAFKYWLFPLWQHRYVSVTLEPFVQIVFKEHIILSKCQNTYINISL